MPWKTSPEQEYTGERVLTIVGATRDDGDTNLGASFCKHHGTEKCPHDGKCPTPGYCGEFIFNASDVPGAIALFNQDADKHRIQA